MQSNSMHANNVFRVLTSHYCSGFKDSSRSAVISRQEGPSIPNVKFLLKSESIWNLIFVVNLSPFKMNCNITHLIKNNSVQYFILLTLKNHCPVGRVVFVLAVYLFHLDIVLEFLQ